MKCPFALLVAPLGISIATLVMFVLQFDVDVKRLAKNPKFVGSAVTLLAPHFLYYIVWNHAAKFHRMFGNGVRAFHYLVLLFKIFQFSAYAVWYDEQFTLKQEYLAVAAALIFFGSMLNSIVYKKLGQTGVYYGFKFGHNVEWANGFPFNVMRHPQYFGSLLSFAGIALVVSNPLIQNQIVVLFLLQLVGYACTAHMESCGDQDKALQKKKDITESDEKTEQKAECEIEKSDAEDESMPKKNADSMSPKSEPLCKPKMKRSDTPNPIRAQ